VRDRADNELPVSNLELELTLKAGLLDDHPRDANSLGVADSDELRLDRCGHGITL
jgi:hypothetical protein